MIDFASEFLRIFAIEIMYTSPILLFLVFLIGLTGYLIGRIEGWSRFDSLYHAFINATTVGYGDFHPTRKPSKLLAVCNAIMGLILTGIVVAIGLHATDYALKAAQERGDIVIELAD